MARFLDPPAAKPLLPKEKIDSTYKSMRFKVFLGAFLGYAGYYLVRKVFDVENADLGRYDDELGETLGEALLRPTVIYVKPVLR